MSRHYGLDPLSRWDLPEVLSLIDQRKYFLMHAPRQTGKTTCLQALANNLNDKGQHACVYMSVERARTCSSDVDRALQAILDELAIQAQVQLGDDWLHQHYREILRLHLGEGALITALRQWCKQNRKPIVLLMDEIDSLADISLVSILQQLRNGYGDRRRIPFPQTVLLCGMRDLRDYNMQVDAHTGATPSPFNIKSDSLRLGDFSLQDVCTLYDQHTQATGQQFEKGVYERVFELTQGQPWLVNALAYDVCFRNKAGCDRSKVITVDAIDAAKEQLIQRRETHLDQLMAKLKQERVRRVIEPMLLGIEQPMSPQDVEYVQDLGLIHCELNGEMRIANPIYHEIIPRQLSYKHQLGMQRRQADYITTAGQLDMKKLLQTFQQFFRENSDSWLEQFQYKEAGPHLILQAFLQRIINGGGSIHREYALGRGRTDLLVTWPHTAALAQSLSSNDTQSRQSSLGLQRKQMIVLELKLIHQNDSFKNKMSQALEQTARYMNTCGSPEGHLLIFDRRAGRSWEERIWVKQEKSPDGKAITVWGL